MWCVSVVCVCGVCLWCVSVVCVCVAVCVRCGVARSKRSPFVHSKRPRVYRLRDGRRSVILRAEDVTRRPPHRCTEGLKCLDEHTSLDGHVQRSVDVQTLEWLGRPKLLKVGHESGHSVVDDGMIHCSCIEHTAPCIELKAPASSTRPLLRFILCDLATHREPCGRQEVLPEELMNSLKLLPFTLSAKGAELSLRSQRIRRL